MSGALPPAGLPGDAFPPPASPRPTPAPPSLPQPSRDLRVLAGQKRGTEAEPLLGAGSPSPFSASATPPCRAWGHQTRSQGPQGGEGYPTAASQQRVQEKESSSPHPSLPGAPQGLPSLRPLASLGRTSSPREQDLNTWQPIPHLPAFISDLDPLGTPPSPQPRAAREEVGTPWPPCHGHALFLGRKDLCLTPPCVLRGPSAADPLLHFQLLSPVSCVNVLCHLARASLHLGPLPVVPSPHPSAPPSTLFTVGLESHNCPGPWSAWSPCPDAVRLPSESSLGCVARLTLGHPARTGGRVASGLSSS